MNINALDKHRFEDERLTTNLSRMFWLAIIIVVSQIVIIVFDTLLPKAMAIKSYILIPTKYYLFLSCMTILIGAVYCALIGIVIKRRIKTRGVKVFLVNSLLLLYIVIQMTFCTFNILTHQEIIVQMMLALLVGVILVLKPGQAIFIITSSALYTFFLMMMTQWNKDTNGLSQWEKFILSNKCTYFFLTIGLAIFASIVIYRMYISNFLLVSKLRDLSETDSLTNLLNRRKFDEIINREWRRAGRQGSALVLIVFDIDCFKKYNDTYGHVKGDECLSLVGKTLRDSFQRANEYVARYGGEEFAIIMGNAGENEGTLACMRLIEKIAALKIPHAESKPANIVTVSVGMITTIPKEGDRLENFISKADLALYKAKNDGKNRYVIAKAD